MKNRITLLKRNRGILRKISKTYQVVNFLTKEHCKNISVAIGKARRHKEITKNIKSDRVYYILKGRLVVKSGNKKFIINKRDIIFIPKNTNYQFQGTFEAVLINSPAFNPKNERINKIK